MTLEPSNFRRVLNDSGHAGHTLALGFYPGRGAATFVRLASGTLFEPTESKLVWYIDLASPVQAGDSIDVAWDSAGRSSLLRHAQWLPKQSDPELLHAADASPPALQEFIDKSDDFCELMRQWNESIQCPTSAQTKVERAQKQLFYEIESVIHPDGETTDLQTHGVLLAEWLRKRNFSRAVHAREGRPLGGSPSSRAAESTKLPSDILDAALAIEDWLQGLIMELAQSPDQEEQARALGSAFDAFSKGELQWNDSNFGIPDSPQIALFAEMAILFREVAPGKRLWLAALPALVRGVEIFQEMAWSGRKRDDDSYTVLNYLDSDASTDPTKLPAVRKFPSRRYEELLHFRCEQDIETPKAIIRLEYEFGCLCLHMLRDDMMRRSLDSSSSTVAEANHATIKDYFKDLVSNPIVRDGR